MENITKSIILLILAFSAAIYLSSACGGGGTATLASITVTPATPSIAVNATQQFTATGTRSDSSTVDLTATVTWASSDTAVAAFQTTDTSGLATALTGGTTTISATDPDSGISGSTDMTVAALSGTIKALYSTSGTNWNDYVKNDGADIFTATDTACNAATDGPWYNACLNGGLLRTVEVTGRSVCDDLTATDSLGAFTWVCDDTTNDVRMVSVGFADGMGLSDVIDFDTASWKQMNVTVYRGGNPYLATDMAAWWGNTIVVNNTGAAMNEGEVNIVTVNNVNNYPISSVDKVALLIKPGLTITGPAGPTNVIDAAFSDFLWIEGSVDVTGKDNGVLFDNVRFSQVRNVKTSNGNAAGVRLTDSTDNQIIYSTAANNADVGFHLDNASNNVLSDLSSTNNGSEGVEMSNSSSDNIVLNTTSASSGDDGIYVLSATNNVVVNVSTPIGTYGVFLGASSNNNTFMNVNVVNGADSGIWFSTSSSNTVTNVLSAYSGCEAILLQNSSNNYFTGVFKVGNDGTCAKVCAESGGTNPGVTDTSCAQDGSSDYGTPVLNPDISNSFIAKVSSDTVNADGATGTKAVGSITDWVNFENQFRGWGVDGGTFPASTNRDNCLAGDCRIWDWSLVSGDAVIRDVLTLPTGADTLTHNWTSGSVTFLRNAVEILGDGTGNDNGLCESNETCLYTPNIGSYQGYGNLISAGAFTDGTISGVTLMKYETNGR